MAGSGYTVRTDELESGSRQVSGLVGECKQITDLVTAAASALAAAAGHPGVESAALGLGTSALRQYVGAGTGIKNTAEQLSASAEAYAKAENDSASSVQGLASRWGG